MNTKFNLKQRNLKLALVSAFLLGGATVSGQSFAATDSATATGTVIIPIAIAKITDLEFGSFAPGAGGSVTLSPNGTRTATGAILSTVGATLAAAKFDVTGEGSSTYSIAYTGTSAELTSGANNMTLALVSDLTASAITTGTVTTGTLTAGAQSIYVGGTLTVGAAQAAGTYTGTVAVVVEYN